jgi:hypothetical protein
MLDDILDSASSDTLTHGLEPGSRIGSGASFLSSPSAAVSRARLNTNTTLGFLLPQPKGFKLKSTTRSDILSESGVDQDLLHKLEEQNSHLPPQVSPSLVLFFSSFLFDAVYIPQSLVLTAVLFCRTLLRSCWHVWSDRMDC